MIKQDLLLLDCSTRTRLTLLREELTIATIDAAIVVNSVADSAGEQFGEDEEIKVKIFLSTADLKRLDIGRNDWLTNSDYTFVIVNQPVIIDKEYSVCAAKRKAAIKTTR